MAGGERRQGAPVDLVADRGQCVEHDQMLRTLVMGEPLLAQVLAQLRKGDFGRGVRDHAGANLFAEHRIGHSHHAHLAQ